LDVSLGDWYTGSNVDLSAATRRQLSGGGWRTPPATATEVPIGRTASEADVYFSALSRYDEAMIADAVDAFAQIFTPPFRATLLKSLGLTIGLLVVIWLGLDRLAAYFIRVETSWLATILSVIVGLGLVVGLAFLIAPVTSLVAGFFLDDMAAIVERTIDPAGPAGKPIPAGPAAIFALRFAGLSIVVNLVALALLFAPVVNIVAFLGANGYLLGREYFEFAAMRFRAPAEARAMRSRFEFRIFLAGLIIAGFVAIPILNLCTPLFATALMARVHKRLSGVAAVA
jgi:CysZ protein